MKKKVIESLKDIVKGVLIGNFFVVITYLIFSIYDKEALNSIMQDLLVDYNCAKMIVYASISGALWYSPIIIYKLFGKDKVKSKENKTENISETLKFALKFMIIGIIGIVLFGALNKLTDKIYYLQDFNRMHQILLYILLIGELVIGGFGQLLRQEIKWVNDNIKDRNS